MNHAVTITCITPWSGHYFHGFYNIQPWDPTGRYVLCHRVAFIDRMPQANDEAVIGVIDLAEGRFEPVTRTHAWNFQLGSLAHWLDDVHPGCIIYNIREQGRIASEIRHLATGRRRTIDSPVFAVSHDARVALGFDLARPHAINPGYAYAGVPYDLPGQSAPADQGVNRIDLQTGQCTMILSFNELKERFFVPGMAEQPLIMGRVLFNACDTRLVLSFRFRDPGTRRWATSLVSANLDGSDPWQIVPFDWQPAHFDWFGGDRLLVWCRPPGSSRAGFHLVRDHTRDASPFAPELMEVDGHCCYSPDASQLASDTFPDSQRQQSLIVLPADGSQKRVLGRFEAPPAFRGDLRCDLHPCWNRTGTAIAFDSLHENRRAVYVATLNESASRIARRPLPSAP